MTTRTVYIEAAVPSLYDILGFLHSQLAEGRGTSFSCILSEITSVQIRGCGGSIVYRSAVASFVLVCDYVPLFYLNFNVPVTSLGSFVFFLGRLVYSAPSVLGSGFPFSSSLVRRATH